MLPERIDEYRIVRELGAGGMGTVYEGVHITLSQRVAIKVVRPEYSRDSEVEQRFLKEAMTLARIVHPSVVKIHTFGFLPDGTSYLVMEFLSGESLAQRWGKAGQRLDLLKELRIVHQIADVLAVLHRSGVIHRDLKPENVIVVSDADSPGQHRAKLVDFGLAKLVRVSGPHTTSTVIMGTPAYMSPEQCRGAGQVDALTDCYALGVMLYELIARRLPFESQWAGELIGNHLHVEPPPLALYAPHVDARLCALVHDLLSKEKILRPTMTEVAGQLESLLTELQGGAEAGPHLSPNLGVDVFAATGAGPPRALPQADELAQTQGAPLPGPSPRREPDRSPAPSPAGAANRAAPPARRPPRLAGKLAQYVWIGGPIALLLGWSIYTIISLIFELREERAKLEINKHIELVSPPLQPVLAKHNSTSISALNKNNIMDNYSTDNDTGEQRISGNDPQPPGYLSAFIPCTKVVGKYQICSFSNGTVDSVEPIISIPGVDHIILETLSAWRFAARPDRRCFHQTISFLIENQEHSCLQYKAILKQTVIIPFEWLSENMKGGIYLNPMWPSQLTPLSDCQIRQSSYELCINSEGKINSVEIVQGLNTEIGAADREVMDSLSKWRFRQIAFPICTTHIITFRGPRDPANCASQ